MSEKNAGWIKQGINLPSDGIGERKTVVCLISHRTYLELCMRGLCEELPKIASEIISKGGEVGEENIREWIINKFGPYYSEEQIQEFLDKLATLNEHDLHLKK